MKRSRRSGAIIMVAVILICGAILLGTGGYLTVIALTGRRIQHQRNTVQCVYAAESGVQVALARMNAGRAPADPITGEVGGARFETRVSLDGSGATITSDGFQDRPGRGILARRVQVECVRSPAAYRVTSWQTLPPPDLPENVRAVPERGIQP